MSDNNSVSFSSEEVEALKSMQVSFNQLTSRLGQLVYEKDVIERELSSIEDALRELETERNNVLNQLQSKYGEGTLDLESGRFTPSE